MALPLVLAGPIVRRVDPRTVAVWIAFSQARRVSLQVFRGPVIVGGGSLPAVEASGAADTLSLGANLHIVVVTATPPAPATLTPGTEFAYNLSFAPPGGGAAADLQSEGLLADGTLANGLPHLALGYGVNALPGFRTPPAAVSDLRLAHGSCRKPHDLGVDALVELDNRLRPGTPPQQVPPAMAPRRLQAPLVHPATGRGAARSSASCSPRDRSASLRCRSLDQDASLATSGGSRDLPESHLCS